MTFMQETLALRQRSLRTAWFTFLVTLVVYTIVFFADGVPYFGNYLPRGLWLLVIPMIGFSMTMVPQLIVRSGERLNNKATYHDENVGFWLSICLGATEGLLLSDKVVPPNEPIVPNLVAWCIVGSFGLRTVFLIFRIFVYLFDKDAGWLPEEMTLNISTAATIAALMCLGHQTVVVEAGGIMGAITALLLAFGVGGTSLIVNACLPSFFFAIGDQLVSRSFWARFGLASNESPKGAI